MRIKELIEKLLSDTTKRRIERATLTIAIASFILHLVLILLVEMGWVHLESELLDNPIAAIYTPFSFILVYEVYLLVFYLPRSITTYIGKQYEIITLILIRRLFKDLANLKLSSNWFELQGDLQFTYDLLSSVVLFYLIYLFFLQSRKRRELIREGEPSNANIEVFIGLKKVIAAFLIPILFSAATFLFVSWCLNALGIVETLSYSFKNINNLFFDEFFTILIIVDVILLLASFYYSDQFHKVIRNSGFVLSTILIRISFSVEGVLNNLLIICAIVFGLLMLLIHNKFEKQLQQGPSS
jgi:hypothetical protein